MPTLRLSWDDIFLAGTLLPDRSKAVSKILQWRTEGSELEIWTDKDLDLDIRVDGEVSLVEVCVSIKYFATIRLEHHNSIKSLLPRWRVR